MDQWILIDCRIEVSEVSEFPRWQIESIQQLVDLLEKQGADDPGVFMLEKGNVKFELGVGDKYGYIKFFQEEKFRWRCFTELPYAEEEDFFRLEGYHYDTPVDHLLPVNQILQIVSYFYQTEKLLPGTLWRVWDIENRKWDRRQINDDGTIQISNVVV